MYSSSFAGRTRRALLVTALLVTCLLVSLLSSSVEARSCRPDLIPNGRVNRCSNCHLRASGGGTRTPFGEDVFSALSTPRSQCNGNEFWGEALALEDSDEDGILNGVELGDPLGEWRPGDSQPGDPAEITNPGVEDCPQEGDPGFADTRCVGITIEGPDGDVPGSYTVTALAEDDSGDEITYEFSAIGAEQFTTGLQSESSTDFDLPAGTWLIEVIVNDGCDGIGEQAICAEEIVVEEPSPPSEVGPFSRGDVNADGGLDVSDGVAVLVWLFLGAPEPLCLAAANANGDANVDLADSSFLLNFLFLGGPAPSQPPLGCAVSELEIDIEIGCVTRHACGG